MTRAALLAASLLLSCGTGRSSKDDAGIPPPDCPTHDDATFELGTGATRFEPLVDGQHLPMIRGLQGGCHFWISIRTDGFAERRFKLRYDVTYTDSGTTTGSRSSFTKRLRPADGSPGICEQVGITGFLIEPWRFVGQPVTLTVGVEDDEGRTASESRDIVGDWPEGGGDDACGSRG